MITTCLFSLSVQYELRLITLAMPEWWELYYSVLLCVLTLFSSYSIRASTLCPKDKKTDKQVVPRCSCSPRSSPPPGTAPRRSCLWRSAAKHNKQKTDFISRTCQTGPGIVERNYSCLLSGLHIEAMERWLHQKCCFTRLPAAKPGNRINMDDQVTLRSF